MSAPADHPSPQVSVAPMKSSDLPALVPIYLNSFHGYMSARLGTRYVHAMFRWFLDAGDGVALVARAMGRPAGFVFGAPAGYNSRLYRDLAGVACFALLAHPRVLLQRRVLDLLAARARILIRPRTGKPEVTMQDDGGGMRLMSLVGIGVHQRARRLKAGSKLMQRFEQEARERGMDGLRLSVYRDNTAARALYERMGWEAVDTGRATLYYRKLFLDQE